MNENVVTAPPDADYFTIERSFDVVGPRRIGFVKGDERTILELGRPFRHGNFS